MSSYAEARRMAQMANSGIGPDSYRGELADRAYEEAAGAQMEDWYRQGNDNYQNMLKWGQLNQIGLDQASQVNQQNILAEEQRRRNAETAARYAFLNQQSANQLAGQRSMMQGLQGIMGGQGGVLGGLFGASQGSKFGGTSMTGADGKPIGGGTFRTNSPLSALSGFSKVSFG